MADAARVGRDTADWQWFLEHAAFPGPQQGAPIIFGLDVIEHAEGGATSWSSCFKWCGPTWEGSPSTPP